MKNLGYARLAAALALVTLGANASAATDAVCKTSTSDELRKTFANQSARLIAKRATPKTSPIAKIKTPKRQRKAA